MLDFSKLKAPPGDGEVLVAPDPTTCVQAALHNAAALARCEVKIAGAPLLHWRRMTRARFLGPSDQPVVVTGHQPAFIHPGVWAKHVVAQALARAIGGRAVNLIVDNDAPHETTIAVPSVEKGGVGLTRVSFASVPHGHAYEQIPLHSRERVDRFRHGLEEVLQDRYSATQLPVFFSGFDSADSATDWVDQAVAGRRAIEAPFGVDLLDRRVSRFCWEPLLIELITNAQRFSSAYNDALAEYRRRYRIRGRQRPIPDLAVETGVGGSRCELPVWAYRKGEARRRVYVSCGGSSVCLEAEGELIAELGCDVASDPDRWPIQPGSEAGWMLRPRALMLTLWARLFLADLFIHGIGGAKYDRITDLLIADYFGIEPPKMACVSATLWLDLPRHGVTIDQVREQARILRDKKWNPQRYAGAGIGVCELVRERAEAIALSKRLRSESGGQRTKRRAVFERIRRLNGAMQELVVAADSSRGGLAVALEEAVKQFRRDEIARGRDYFFGLQTSKDLGRLVEALPDQRSFRV